MFSKFKLNKQTYFVDNKQLKTAIKQIRSYKQFIPEKMLGKKRKGITERNGSYPEIVQIHSTKSEFDQLPTQGQLENYPEIPINMHGRSLSIMQKLNNTCEGKTNEFPSNHPSKLLEINCT